MNPFRFAQFCLFEMPLMAMGAVQGVFARPQAPIIPASDPRTGNYRDPDGRRGPDPIAKDILG